MKLAAEERKRGKGGGEGEGEGTSLGSNIPSLSPIQFHCGPKEK